MYVNRKSAGDLLATQLTAYADHPDVVVLGCPRGGVPVAARVAAALRAPLDVLVVRKLGVPWAPEVAFGALGPDGVTVHNPEVESRIAPQDADAITADAADEVARRETLYRHGKPPLSLLAGPPSWSTMASPPGHRAGGDRRGARSRVASVVLAVPVAAADAIAMLRREADEVVCPLRGRAYSARSAGSMTHSRRSATTR